MIRSGRDDGNETTGAESTDPTGSTDGNEGDGVAVVCIPELTEVCDALADADPSRPVRTEAAATTLEALAASESDDAPLIWVTVRPFPGMVDAQRATTGAPALALAETAVGSTPLAVALLDAPRLAALAATCGELDIWACLGEHAGQPWTELGGDAAWGTVRPAVGDVAGSATALVSFGAATSGYFGNTTFNRATWESDTGFLGWLRPLARTVSVSDLSGGTPVATMATRASPLNAAATTDAELAALGAAGRPFRHGLPSVGDVTGRGDRRRPTASTTSMTWSPRRPRHSPTPAGEHPPTAANGPSASTTLALLELWEATT